MTTVVAIQKQVKELKQHFLPNRGPKIILHMWMPKTVPPPSNEGCIRVVPLTDAEVAEIRKKKDVEP